MLKTHSFCVNALELLQTSFVGSISQQPAPISIYPDMDRQMRIGWPVLGCTRCSLSKIGSWRATGWQPTGLITLAADVEDEAFSALAATAAERAKARIQDIR